MRRKVRSYLFEKLGRLLMQPRAARESPRSLGCVTFSKLGHWGQFGNQLFQISAVLGYAAKYRCRPKLPLWRCSYSGLNYGDYFPRLSHYYYLGQYDGAVYHEQNFSYNEIPFIYNVDLRGLFQSEKYFVFIQDKIRGIFKEPEYAEAILNSYCAEHRLFEFNAIHFRFYNHPLNDKGHVVEALPDSYFLNALERLGSTRPLVVATDNQASLREFMARNRVTQKFYVLMFDHPLLDFFMLTRAERIAISNSSFSWWAAYLGKKKLEILAPQRYYWFNSIESRNPFWNTKDLYPEDFKELIF